MSLDVDSVYRKSLKDRKGWIWIFRWAQFRNSYFREIKPVQYL